MVQMNISSRPKTSGKLLRGADTKPFALSIIRAKPPNIMVANRGGNQRVFMFREAVGVIHHMIRVNVIDTPMNRNGGPILQSC